MAERALSIVDTSNERPLAVAQPGPRLGLPTPSEMESLKSYGQMVVNSGLAPKHIDKWETAVVIMRYGHQLGVDEFTALQNMYVIGGKPSMMATLMHAMILRDHGDDAVHVRISNADRCELLCKRRNASQSSLVTYTMAEAIAAGLPTSNAVWKKYPADLLFARAISRAGRQVFRDSTMGLYVPEEIGGNVVEVGGEYIETTSRPVDVKPLAVGLETASEDQFKRIAALAKELGLTKKDQIKAKSGKAIDTLTPNEAAALIGEWESEIESIRQPIPEVLDVTPNEPRSLIPEDEDLDTIIGTSGNDPYTS